MEKSFLLAKLGPIITRALNDNSVNEIILNPDEKIWLIYEDGEQCHVGSLPQRDSFCFVNGLAQYLNLYLSEDKPYLDAMLPFNGERINLTIPPVSNGVSFNIRKPNEKIYTLSDYQKQKVLTPHQAIYLYEALRARKNILVSGGPGSGKTTFVTSLLNAIETVEPRGHRILILEQVPELTTNALNHKVMLTTENVDLQTLLWLSMRQSPGRIVVGEVRDGAALQMLKAWNTGCPGGVATVHASTPVGAIQRVLDLSLEVCLSPPIKQAADAIDVIVQLSIDESRDVGRYVSSIVEVNGFDEKTNEFITRSVGENHVYETSCER